MHIVFVIVRSVVLRWYLYLMWLIRKGSYLIRSSSTRMSWKQSGIITDHPVMAQGCQVIEGLVISRYKLTNIFQCLSLISNLLFFSRAKLTNVTALQSRICLCRSIESVGSQSTKWRLLTWHVRGWLASFLKGLFSLGMVVLGPLEIVLPLPLPYPHPTFKVIECKNWSVTITEMSPKLTFHLKESSIKQKFIVFYLKRLNFFFA